MSAIERIPVEMLVKIFLHACLDGEDPVEANTAAPPWIITHVSNYWRAIAMAMPEIWSALMVVTDYPTPKLIRLLETWIGRSGQRSLKVVLSLSHDMSGDWHHDGMMRVLEVFFNQTHRWRDIHFTSDNPDLGSLLSALLPQGGGNMPLLESFAMDTGLGLNGIENDFAEAHIAHFLAYAPRLATLMWFDETISRGSHESWRPLSFPVNQLRKLKLSCDMSAEELVDLLAACYMLENAAFEIAATVHPHLRDPGMITHHKLRRLQIQYCHEAEPFLSRLTLPALQELTVEQVDGTTWLHEPLLTFLARSRMPLRKLKLIVDLRTMQHLTMQTLRHLPALEYLCLQDLGEPSARTTGSELMHLLSVESANGGFELCPRLRRLSLSNVNHAPIPPFLLVALIQRRHRMFENCAHGQAHMRFLIELRFLDRHDFLSIMNLQRLGVAVELGFDTQVDINNDDDGMEF